MMNVFSVLKQYAGKWDVVNTRNFNSEEIADVESAVVVPSEYGNSVRFCKTNGSVVFIPLSTESSLVVGEPFDVTTGKLLTLAKPGEENIFRVIE